MKHDFARFGQMAALTDMAANAQEGTILHLDPSQVRVEEQVRTVFEDIEELADSMRIEQQSPIIVSPLDKNTNTYLLQKGERRLRAAILIGGGFKIKAIVDSTVRTDAAAVVSQMMENVHRNDFKPIEIAKGLVALRTLLKEQGLKGTGKELAHHMKKPESWISKHLALAELPDELAQLVADKRMLDAELIQSLLRISELSPDLYLELMVKARTEEGVGRQEARDHLKRLRGGSPTPADQDGLGVQPTSKGDHASSGSATPEQPVGGEAQRTPANDSAATVRVIPTEHQVGQGANPPSSEENISHAKSSGAVPGLANPKVPAPRAANSTSRKVGKYEVIQIDASNAVMQVRINTEKKVITGELRLDQAVRGKPSKGFVTYLDGGKQHEAVFDLELIEIITLTQLAQDD